MEVYTLYFFSSFHLFNISRSKDPVGVQHAVCEGGEATGDDGKGGEPRQQVAAPVVGPLPADGGLHLRPEVRVAAVLLTEEEGKAAVAAGRVAHAQQVGVQGGARVARQAAGEEEVRSE